MSPSALISRRSFLLDLLVSAPLLHADIIYPRPFERTYALVVGIDRYASPRIPPLTGPVIDARGFLSVITDQSTGVVDSKDAFLLLNEAATREGILSAVKKIRQVLIGYENFIFYFSGHSAPLGDDGALISYDGRQPGISDISFESDIIPLASTDKGYFIIIGDSCRIGASLVPRINLRHPKVGVLSASREGEMAYEVKGGGVMTLALLKALSDPNSDLDGDGSISLDEAQEGYRQCKNSIALHSVDLLAPYWVELNAKTASVGTERENASPAFSV